jgi:hypothetical protein
MYTWSNPPPALLERELNRFPAWLVWLALISPRLELFSATATALGGDTYRVTLVVHNTGWLPTYVTKIAQKNKRSRGLVCEIELPDGVTLESGRVRVEAGELEGRAYKSASPSSWGGWGGDMTVDRAKVEWVIRGAPGTQVGLVARHDRAGLVRTVVTLG